MDNYTRNLPADIQVTAYVALLHRRLFGNAAVTRRMIAVASALACRLGKEGRGKTTVEEIARMIRLSPEYVREDLHSLSRLKMWAELKRPNRPTEWWIKVAQLPLFGEMDSTMGRGPSQNGKHHGARSISDGKHHGARSDIRNSSNVFVTDNTSREVVAKSGPAAADPMLLLFLENDYGISPTEAATIAERRSIEWAHDWVSVWPYYPKPIDNPAGFLVNADAGNWKIPPACLRKRDRERAEIAGLKLRHDEFTTRRAADEAARAAGPPEVIDDDPNPTPEALERVRVIRERLRARRR